MQKKKGLGERPCVWGKFGASDVSVDLPRDDTIDTRGRVVRATDGEMTRVVFAAMAPACSKMWRYLPRGFCGNFVITTTAQLDGFVFFSTTVSHTHTFFSLRSHGSMGVPIF